MASKTSARRSTRLLSKQPPIELPSRPKRQIKKPPVIIAVDSDSDDGVPLSAFLRKEKKPPLRIISSSDTDESPQKEKPPRTPHKTKSKSQDPHAVTPPKQRKCEENVAPPTTPTDLLDKLSLNGSAEKHNRRKLFEDKDVYQNATRALHSTFPTTMPGREKELEELKEFIQGHVEEETSGSMYISGPPGTGKTALLNLIVQQPQIKDSIKEMYVNCTAIKSSGAIFSRIAKNLGVKSAGKSERDHLNAIENYLQKTHKPILLVLDEIDQLESKNQSVLYTIFEWPARPASRLILIGIANALDLTDRILPRLQARCELKPLLMHFAPYTKQQIIEIFTSRLKSAGVLDVFSPAALQMLSGKVAAVSGDLRRALDIGRRVLELVNKRKQNNVLRSLDNLATELDSVQKDKKPEIVDLQQVVSVLNKVYGTSQNLDEEIDDSLPLQQKIAVCSLLLILKKAKNKDVTVGRLHEVYRKVCMRRNIQVVDQGEFVGLCSLIETRGILRIIKKKDPRLGKVSLVWDEEEVATVLRDKQLMSMILQDDACLGKM